MSSIPESAPSRAPRRRTTIIVIALIALGAVVGIGATSALLAGSPGDASASVRWPATAAAASIGTEELHGSGADQPRPIGSIAKLVTALVVLQRVPLAPGQPGPMFPMTEQDVQLFQDQQARGLQTAPVEAGQQLSTRDLLARSLVLSSNNHTLSLVDRIFGGELAYLQAAREWLHAKRITGIELADATGASPQTRGTPTALMQLGRLADADPTIRELVAQGSVQDGTTLLRGTNDLLGVSGIDGLKTGNTDAAGYCILFSAPLHPGDAHDSRRIIGVVLGSASEGQRAADIVRLLGSLRKMPG